MPYFVQPKSVHTRKSEHIITITAFTQNYGEQDIKHAATKFPALP